MCVCVRVAVVSHPHNDVPPEAHQNVSMAAVRGAVRPSMCVLEGCQIFCRLSRVGGETGRS